MPSQQSPLGAPPLTVLLVENEDGHRATMSKVLALRYRVLVAKGRGEALVADALRLATAEAPAIAVVDMRLGDDRDNGDTQGLVLIPRLRPCLAIVSTAFGTKQTIYEALQHQGAHDFVGKELGPEALYNAIEAVAPLYCRCAHSGTAHWHPIASRSPDGPVLTAPPEGARPMPELVAGMDRAAQAALVEQLVAHVASYRQQPAPPQPAGVLYDWYLGPETPAASSPLTLRLSSGVTIALPDPAVWAYAQRGESAVEGATCVAGHRALGLASILVDEQGAGWIANQRYGGVHHRLYDLVRLELDVIAQLGPGPSEDPQAFYELALAVLAPIGADEPLGATNRLVKAEPAAGAYGLLAAIRRAACRWSPHRDARERVWALLLGALSRLRTERDSQRARECLRQFAALACLRLHSWGERWPLAGWDEPVWVEASDHPGKVVADLFRLVASAESGVVVGLPHMSRLRLLQQFVLRPDVQRLYLGSAAASTLLVLVNCDRMQKRDDYALFELMLTALAERTTSLARTSVEGQLIDRLRRETLASESALLAQRSLEHAIATVLGSGGDDGLTLCFLLHNFDEAYLELGEQPLSCLAALAEQHWGRLSYVLGLRDTPARLRVAGASGSFERLFAQPPLFAPPDGRNGALATLSQLERRVERRLPAEARQAIAEASGGHAGLVVALFQAIVADEDGGQQALTLEHAAAIPQVARECRALWRYLAQDERQALSAMMKGRAPADPALVALLVKKGLLRAEADGRVALFSPLFARVMSGAPAHELISRDEHQQFFRGTTHLPLKGDQYELLHFLYRQEGRLCGHDELIEHLYGQNGAALATAMTNLQQLVRRVRVIVEPKKEQWIYLLNVPGHGYRLVGTNLYPALS